MNPQPIHIVGTITPNKKQRLVDEYSFKEKFQSLLDAEALYLEKGYTHSAEVIHAHISGMHGAVELLGLMELACWCEKKTRDL